MRSKLLPQLRDSEIIHQAVVNVKVTVNCQVCVFVLVPRDSTLRFSMVPAAAALNTPHSCQAQFASVVAKVERKVMTFVAPLGYVASIAFLILLVAACRSVCPTA